MSAPTPPRRKTDEIHATRSFKHRTGPIELPRRRRKALLVFAGAIIALWFIAPPHAHAQPAGDMDDNGFIDLRDYVYLEVCLSISGPEYTPLFAECMDRFDIDTDNDVDLADFAAFSRNLGHLPIPLRDSLGQTILMDSTIPYSGRETCGTVGCHDLDDPVGIANGLKFQQGRTDSQGNVVMKDDCFEDGRRWMRSSGRFGIWSQATTLQMAGKDNANESSFDQSAFAWIRDCGGCHVGGGPGEFDRDRMLLYDELTGKFGYEWLGKTAEDVALDGDYADFNYATSQVEPARWDLTGVAGPDCLFCHRRGRIMEPTPYGGELDMIRFWREAALGAGPDMVDNNGDPVPAFAAAATAGQGWFSNIEIVQDGFVPRALTLQIDYSVGVADGILTEQGDGTVALGPLAIASPPTDQACWACHNQKESLNGMVWYDDTPDIHYRKFNNLSNDDPTDDIAGEKSTACTYCHPGGLDHNFAKGNDLMFQTRNDLDWVNFRSCRDCHLPLYADGTPNLLKHPDAPDVPGSVFIHNIGFVEGNEGGPMRTLSCQACHIPYALGPAIAYFDSTAGGVNWPTMCCAAMTFQYYSADPLDPTNPDKSRWYPGLMPKTDSDGVERLFPAIAWPNIHWADWEQNGTPDDTSDDLLTPIIQWRMHEVIGDAPLPVVTDDDGDGRPEMNRPEEILAYIEALKGNDSYGRQIAARPVLVKGPLVWYEDPDAPNRINSFPHEGTGIPVEWYYYIWGQDHNVLPMEEAWGYNETNPELGCRDCHRPATFDSPVFDRLVLVDPYGPDGQPVYETVRQITGMNPQ